MHRLYDIDSIIDNGMADPARQEFLPAWDPDAVLHTITAFANDIRHQGTGIIIIGAEPGKKGAASVPGLAPGEAERIMDELEDRCSLIKPCYTPAAAVHSYHGAKDVVAVIVPGDNDRPYFCPEKTSPPDLDDDSPAMICWVRRKGRTVRATAGEMEFLDAVQTLAPTDDSLNYQASEEAVDQSLLEEFLTRQGADELLEELHSDGPGEVLSAIDLVADTEAGRLPVNAALLMFSQHPERYFPNAEIRITAGGQEKIFQGPLQRQLAEALKHLESTVISTREILPEGAKAPKKIYSYPREALAEALGNAVIHRLYSPGEDSPVTVEVTPDSILITSTPGPDVTDSDLAAGRLRGDFNNNRRLPDFLAAYGLARGDGKGIQRMQKAMKDNGSNPPEFRSDVEASFITVVLPLHSSFRDPEQG